MVFLLVIYFIYLIGFIVVSILGLYHLWKFGFRGDLSKIAMVTYSIVAGLIIIFSLIVILSLDWDIANFPNYSNVFSRFFGD